MEDTAIKPTEINVGGRPTKYMAAFNRQVQKLCLLGATEKEVADFFDVSIATITNWKQEYPRFLASMQKGKLIADANVADGLYRRAVGYKHHSEEIRVVSQGKGEPSEIVRVPVIKQYPPDTEAATRWLYNRRKSDWRNRIDHTTDGKEIRNLTSEQLFERMSDIVAKVKQEIPNE